MSVSKVVNVFVNTRSHNSSVMSALLVFIRLRGISLNKRLDTHTNLLQTMHAQQTQGDTLTHLGLSSARECNLWVDLREYRKRDDWLEVCCDTEEAATCRLPSVYSDIL